MTLDALIAIWTVHVRLLPVLLLRGAVYAALGVGVLAMSLLGALLGMLWDLLAPTSGTALPAGAALGFVVGVALLRALAAQVRYLLDATHAALAIATLEGRDIPRGRAQIGSGAQTVRSRYGRAPEMASLDAHVRDVLRGLPRLVQGVLLLPGFRRAQRVQRLLLRQSMSALQPVVLAHTLREGARNPWLSARVALVLHAQAGRPILLRAARGAGAVWLVTGLLFLLLLPSAGLITDLMPGDWWADSIAVAALLTWVVKAAIVDPTALTALLRTSLALTDPLPPNPDWEDKLETAAPAFHAMGRKAVAWHVPAARARHRQDAAGSGERQGS